MKTKELFEARIVKIDIFILSKPALNLADLYDGDDDDIVDRVKHHDPTFTKERAKEILERLKTKGEVSYGIWRPSHVQYGIDTPLAQFHVWTSERLGELSYVIKDLMLEKGVKVDVWTGEFRNDGTEFFQKYEGQNLLESEQKKWELI